jgi:HNH endonuclease
MPKNITAEEARYLLSYDPATGVFLWKNPKPGMRKGAIAGTTSPFGYRIIMINQVCYRAHWLAWLITTGCWPTNIIDHKNLDGCDNRLANLREATHGQNRANSRCNRRKHDLPKGVFRANGGKFGAQVVSSKVHYYLGVFNTPEEAHAAYMDRAVALHGEFARAA